MKWNHELVRVEERYISFICSAQPSMELISADTVRKCPVCREINPMRMIIQWVEDTP